ncbi:MAG: hypothetical protein IV090_10260 [Candidatus Sericytochromatia bacterium]|nr:hypothetical protein [Candidatus Sericytochromatia bacterium]
MPFHLFKWMGLFSLFSGLLACSINLNEEKFAVQKHPYSLLVPTARNQWVESHLMRADKVNITALKTNQSLEKPTWIALDKDNKLYSTVGGERSDIVYQIDLENGDTKTLPSTGFAKILTNTKRPGDFGGGYIKPRDIVPTLAIDKDNNIIIVLGPDTARTSILSKQIRYLNSSNTSDEVVEVKTPVLKLEGEPAQLKAPQGIVINEDGVIFIADTDNHCIRKIEQGVLTTFVGSAQKERGLKDGKGLDARFDSPIGLAINTKGEIYVTDSGNRSLRKITRNREVVTVIAPGLKTNPKGYPSPFSQPTGIAVDKNDILYISDSFSHQIFKLSADRTELISLVGRSTCPPRDKCRGDLASLNEPWGLTLDQRGLLLVADKGNQLIRQISPLSED